MHWADKIAERILEARPEKEEYVCAAGISPSGSVHIGNFRDVAIAFFVARALQDLGKTTRLLFSWDEFDRFRKVPANIPDNFSQYIGKPYTAIPDPFGCHPSYSAHFESEFEDAIRNLGIQLDYRYQASEYQSGRYSEWIITALRKRKQIYDILAAFRTQPPSEKERENYYPISIYCSICGKDDIEVESFSDDSQEVTYCCKCGNREILDLTKGGNFKLPWKIDWPMRWMYEKVDFEPGGKDHASIGGSFYVAKRISEVIFEHPAPMFQGYEFIGLTGTTSKMSGSSGSSLTPSELLNIYQPEIIRWMFTRFVPNKAFNLCLDEEILRQYDEFDRALTIVRQGRASDQIRRNIEMSLIEGRKLVTVPFRQLASFSTVVHGNLDVLEQMFARLNTPYKKSEFKERLEKAEYWLHNYSPESVTNLRESPDHEYFSQLREEEKQWVHALRESLSKTDLTFDELTVLLYSIPKVPGITDQENKSRQREFFSIVYKLLIGKDTGPRLATFLKALDPKQVLPLLSFSSNQKLPNEETVHLYRAIWADQKIYDELLARKPILPDGITSKEELDNLVGMAIENFGSIRMAAMQHLTGAFGPAPNVRGKPIFTFWTRKQEMAEQRLREPSYCNLGAIPIIIECEIQMSPRVIVAKDSGIYQEKIFEGADYTFEDFEPEDEVFVAEPVYHYSVTKYNERTLERENGAL